MEPSNIQSKTPLLHYTEKDVENILETYGRTTADVKKDVATIRAWLDTQPHLPMQPEDRQIVLFLVRNKFSVEKTKQRLDMNYTIKTLIPEFYRDKFPTTPDVRVAFDVCSTICLPKLTPNLNRIIVQRFTLDDEKDFALEDYYANLFMMLDLRTKLDLCVSDEYICDLSGASFKVISKLGVMDIKKGATIIEKVYSNRVAAVHILNLPKFAQPMLDLLRKFLNPKIAGRIILHSDCQSLHSVYPKEILPKDFGGLEKELRVLIDEWRGLLDSYDGYFRKIQNASVDERLRPEPLKNDEVLGFYGNFRKLDID